jgi:hypothetical protein
MNSNRSTRTDTQKPPKKASLLPWLVVLVVAGCLLIMNNRGVVSPDSDLAWDMTTQSFGQSRTYDHGWPWTWMQSVPIANSPNVPAISQNGLLPAAKLSKATDAESVWPFSAQSTNVQWGVLGLNALVAALLLFFVFIVARNRWSRQRGLSFSLLDIGICVLLVSLVFANDQHHRSLKKRERESESLFSDNFQIKESKWCGPDWLRSLIGEHRWMKHYRHASRIKCEMAGLNGDLSQQLAGFPELRDLEVQGDLSLAQLESLSKIQFETISVSQQLSSQRRHAGNFNDGEPHAARINKAKVLLPTVVELNLNFSLHPENCWPRAIDLLSCCPNLKKVSLQGKQFLVEDLELLPSTIEEIAYDFCTLPREIADFRRRNPQVTVTRMGSGAWDNPKMLVAENRVNRRRRFGWDGSKFSSWCIDLTATDVDRKFLESLGTEFPKVYVLKFGSFDSVDTAIWIAHQCPDLRQLDAVEFPFEFADAMKLPKDLLMLELTQGAITAEEMVVLIKELRPHKLRVHSTSFDLDEMETIGSLSPPWFVDFKR